MCYLSVNFILLILLYLCLSSHTFVNAKKYNHGKSHKSSYAGKKPTKLMTESEENDFVAHDSREHLTETRLNEDMQHLNADELKIYYAMIEEFQKSPDCYIYVSTGGRYNMPIPVTTDPINPKIIHPRKDGMVIFKHNQVIRLSCALSTFVRPVFDVHDLLVKCINGSRLEFEGKPYEFETFICQTTPKPTLKMTDVTCQNRTRNKMMEVGFQTTASFLKLYRICFDRKSKIPVYSWYSAQAPKFRPWQVLPTKPGFNFTNAYHDLNPDVQYKDQKQTVKNILDSKPLSNLFIKFDEEGHYLEPGHLVPQNSFPYPFEQYATYYHENSAAQWKLINDGIWRGVENLLKLKMSHAKHRHLIITGTFKTLSLPDVLKVQHLMYLSQPNEMPIAEYIWKMDYNVDEDKGVVFVSRNNPYEKNREKIKDTICPAIPCPGNLIQLSSYDRSLLYCCNKQTFEMAFGKFDPIVYELFNDF